MSWRRGTRRREHHEDETEDWNALDSYEEYLERKHYCPDVGWVKLPVEDPGEAAELVALTAG